MNLSMIFAAIPSAISRVALKLKEIPEEKAAPKNKNILKLLEAYDKLDVISRLQFINVIINLENLGGELLILKNALCAALRYSFNVLDEPCTFINTKRLEKGIQLFQQSFPLVNPITEEEIKEFIKACITGIKKTFPDFDKHNVYFLFIAVISVDYQEKFDKNLDQIIKDQESRKDQLQNGLKVDLLSEEDTKGSLVKAFELLSKLQLKNDMLTRQVKDLTVSKAAADVKAVAPPLPIAAAMVAAGGAVAMPSGVVVAAQPQPSPPPAPAAPSANAAGVQSQSLSMEPA